jgi:hypothetical protein
VPFLPFLDLDYLDYSGNPTSRHFDYYDYLDYSSNPLGNPISNFWIKNSPACLKEGISSPVICAVQQLVLKGSLDQNKNGR